MPVSQKEILMGQRTSLNKYSHVSLKQKLNFHETKEESHAT
jgi:hypothetical protein